MMLISFRSPLNASVELYLSIFASSVPELFLQTGPLYSLALGKYCQGQRQGEYGRC